MTESSAVMPPVAASPPTFAEAARLWAKVGFLSFGGAAAQIAMLHRFVVEEKRWVEERLFLDALNFATLLPGPEAQQLATYLGWRMHGVRGGIVAGAFFVLPGALVMTALATLYVIGQDLPLVQGLFLGIKAAVLAIVIEALLRIARRALTGPALVAIAAASFLALAVLHLPFPLVVLTAGAVGAVLARQRPHLVSVTPGGALPQPPLGREEARGAFLAALLWLGVWWAPVLAAVLLLGPQHLLVDLGLFFSKLAVVTFGGAYAVLAYLAEAAVHAKGWVTAPEMIDGLGLAETTPGPTILVNQFVGFLAGYRSPAPFGPLAGAILGGAMTVWVTFAPSYLWIFAGAPFFERWRRSPTAQGALRGITAAVCGVIASLAIVFALGVLFAEVGALSAGPARLPWPVWTTLRLDAAVLAVIAAALIFRVHAGVIATVAIMAGMGAVWSLFRLPPL